MADATFQMAHATSPIKDQSSTVWSAMADTVNDEDFFLAFDMPQQEILSEIRRRKWLEKLWLKPELAAIIQDRSQFKIDHNSNFS